MGGMTGNELNVTLAGLFRGPHNRDAIEAVERIASERAGIVTLTGLPGRGKTHILHALTNEMRTLGMDAQYALTVNVLDFLRNAFSPEQPAGEFDERWRLLTEIDCLCIDELDQFNGTPWAMERFQTLMDYRWRAIETKITAFAINTRPGQTLHQTLPEKVTSRLMDGRARIIQVLGEDLRPLLSK